MRCILRIFPADADADADARSNHHSDRKLCFTVNTPPRGTGIRDASVIGT